MVFRIDIKSFLYFTLIFTLYSELFHSIYNIGSHSAEKGVPRLPANSVGFTCQYHICHCSISGTYPTVIIHFISRTYPSRCSNYIANLPFGHTPNPCICIIARSLKARFIFPGCSLHCPVNRHKHPSHHGISLTQKCSRTDFFPAAPMRSGASFPDFLSCFITGITPKRRCRPAPGPIQLLRPGYLLSANHFICPYPDSCGDNGIHPSCTI